MEFSFIGENIFSKENSTVGDGVVHVESPRKNDFGKLSVGDTFFDPSCTEDDFPELQNRRELTSSKKSS